MENQTPSPIPQPPVRRSPTPRRDEREVFTLVILGKRGTGKTTYIRRLVNQSLQAKRRVLIVTPNMDDFASIPLVHPRYTDRIATYKGARKIVTYGEPTEIDNICKIFRHGLLVFDDCRSYLLDKPSVHLKNMLISARHYDVDIIAVGHGVTTVPPQFFTYATHFMIFATTDNPIKRKNDVQNYPAFESAIQSVNREALKQPHTFKIIKNE